MDKFKKDFVLVYMLRNTVATFIITLSAFLYNLTNYYDMLAMRALRKIFTDNLYTTVYFFLMWIFNYLLFELYKILVDIFKNNGKYRGKVVVNEKEIISYGMLFPIILLVVLGLVDFNQLFRVNFILLAAFMLIRSVKEEIKQRKKKK